MSGDIPINVANSEGIPVDSPHSLQSSIELVYVQAANDVLYGNLQNLQNYLQTTQNAISTLTSLQNLQNDINVPDVGNFYSGYYGSLSTFLTSTAGAGVTLDQVNFPGLATYFNSTGVTFEAFSAHGEIGAITEGGNTPTGTTSVKALRPHIHGTTGANSILASQSNYSTAAAAFFNKPVFVSAAFGSGGFAGFQANILSIKTEISTVIIPALSASTPQPVSSESLLAQMRIVQTDLNNFGNFATPADAISWIENSFNSYNAQGVASGGQIQQNITNAITAGESLNTTQTADVRNYLYLFEEYYKSAASILQTITQLITKMADNISS